MDYLKGREHEEVTEAKIRKKNYRYKLDKGEGW